MWDWLKQAANNVAGFVGDTVKNVGTVIKNVVSSDVVQGVAGALGFGSVASVVKSVVAGGETVADKVVASTAAVQQMTPSTTVAKAVENTGITTAAGVKTALPWVLGVGGGLGLILILTRK